jgi:hypothetical protein
VYWEGSYREMSSNEAGKTVSAPHVRYHVSFHRHDDTLQHRQVVGELAWPSFPPESPDELLRYPQLSGYTVLQLPVNTQVSTLQTALEGQLAFSVIASNETLQYATGIQFWGCSMISITILASSASSFIIGTTKIGTTGVTTRTAR